MVQGTPGPRPSRVTRRTFLKGVAASAGLVAGSGLVTGFPTIWAQKLQDITLLPTLSNPIR
jgi:putative spermidine/putrescine transport system substrate-binding protein